MTVSELVARIRRHGGRVWLDRQGRLRAIGVTDARVAALRESRYLVVALLREEIASLRWEHSGKDPDWWRYPEEAWSYPEQRLVAARRPAISDSSRRPGILEDFEPAAYVSHRSAIRVGHATEQKHERELMPVLNALWIRS